MSIALRAGHSRGYDAISHMRKWHHEQHAWLHLITWSNVCTVDRSRKSLLPLGMRQLIFPYSFPGSGHAKEVLLAVKDVKQRVEPCCDVPPPLRQHLSTVVMAASHTLNAAQGGGCKMQPCSPALLPPQQFESIIVIT